MKPPSPQNRAKQGTRARYFGGILARVLSIHDRSAATLLKAPMVATLPQPLGPNDTMPTCINKIWLTICTKRALSKLPSSPCCFPLMTQRCQAATVLPLACAIDFLSPDKGAPYLEAPVARQGDKRTPRIAHTGFTPAQAACTRKQRGGVGNGASQHLDLAKVHRSRSACCNLLQAGGARKVHLRIAWLTSTGRSTNTPQSNHVSHSTGRSKCLGLHGF